MQKIGISFLMAVLMLSCNGNKTTYGTKLIDSNLVPKPVPAIDKTVTIYKKDIYAKTIPYSVLSLLYKKLPNWQLPEPATWYMLWFNIYKKDGCLVNYLPADFNGDHKIDYAFILKHKNTFAVWILQSEGNDYKTIKLNSIGSLNPDSKLLDIGIELAPKGKLDYIDLDKEDSNSIVINNPGITIQKFESAAATYFWKDGKYQSVTTGD